MQIKIKEVAYILKVRQEGQLCGKSYPVATSDAELLLLITLLTYKIEALEKEIKVLGPGWGV